MPDTRIEIEVSLRDAMSPGLRGIGRELSGQAQRIRESSLGAIGGLNKVNIVADQIGLKVRNATGALNALGSAMVGMGRHLLGPDSMASGLETVVRTFNKFAVTNLTTKNLAANAGISIERFNMLSQAAWRAGGTLTEAQLEVSKVGEAFQQILTQEQDAPLIKVLMDMGRRDTAIAVGIAMKTGQTEKAWRLVFDQFVKEGPRGRARLAKEGLSSDPARIQAMIENQSRNVKQYIPNAENMQKISDLQTGARVFFDYVWSGTVMHAITSFSNTIEETKKIYDAGVVASLKRYHEEAMHSSRETARALQNNSFVNLLAGGPTGMVNAWIRQAVHDAVVNTLPKKAAGGIVTSPTIVGEAGPELVIPLPLRGGIEASFERWVMRQHPAVRQFLIQAALPGQRLIGAAQWGDVDWAALAPILISELGPQPLLPVGAFGLSDVGRTLLAELMSTVGDYSLTPVFAGGMSGTVGRGKQIQELTEIEADSNRTLDNINETLKRMKDPLGLKRFAEGGTVEKDTLALVGEKGREIIFPGGVPLPRPRPLFGTKEHVLSQLGLLNADVQFDPSLPKDVYGSSNWKKQQIRLNPTLLGMREFMETGQISPAARVTLQHEGGHFGADILGSDLSGTDEETRQRLADIEYIRGMGSQAMHSRRWRREMEVSRYGVPKDADQVHLENLMNMTRLLNQIAADRIKTSTVTTTVDFGDMPAKQRKVPFMPLKPTTSSQAALAARSSERSNPYAWGY